MANQPDSNNDDIFAPLPSTTDETRSGTPPPLYEPPLYDPQKPKKQGPNILFIVIGSILGAICLCGICLVAVTSGVLIAAGPAIGTVVHDPTFQAASSTVQSGLSNLSNLEDIPDTLPENAETKGKISSSEPQTGTLPLGQQAVWTYNGRSGETLTIRVTSKNGLPMIGLYDTDGKLLKKTTLDIKNGNKPTSQSFDYKFTADGTYSVLLGGIANNYTLEVVSGNN
ncbi:MAG: hypothetical protein ABI947_12000 [Chloroflexota bacterium]